jgi:hypothetical protein
MVVVVVLCCVIIHPSLHTYFFFLIQGMGHLGIGVLDSPKRHGYSFISTLCCFPLITQSHVRL